MEHDAPTVDPARAFQDNPFRHFDSFYDFPQTVLALGGSGGINGLVEGCGQRAPPRTHKIIKRPSVFKHRSLKNLQFLSFDAGVRVLR